MQEEFFMNSMEKDPKLSGEHGGADKEVPCTESRGNPRTESGNSGSG